MKKFILIFAFFTLLIGVMPNKMKVEASEENVIDIYLIAGQSNAAGYTIVDSTAKEELNQMDPRFSTGFEDVLYYGCTNVNVGASLPSMSVQPTKIGLGYTQEHIGPELGMAMYFANSSSNKVGFIKYASGASSIYDDYQSSQNSKRGNWYSPAVEKAIGVPAGDKAISGNCYRVFLDVVRNGLEAYKALGYTPVIKGVAWMQGESESQSQKYSAKYATLLNALISDMRTDLSTITNSDLSTLQFVVAKIPSHYKPTSPSYTDIVREQQQLVDDNDVFVSTIDNEEFTLPGTDAHHYNWSDMLLLGMNFAESFYNTANVSYNTIRFVCNDGGYSSINSLMMKTGDYVENTLFPYRGYELTSASINFYDLEGNPVTVKSYNSGNYLQFQVPDSDLIVKIDFLPIPKYNVSVTSKNGVVYRTNSERNPYRDEVVSFTFKPNDGYELTSLIVNGEEIDLSTLINEDEYPVLSVKVSEDLEVRAVFSSIVNNGGNSNEGVIANPNLRFFNGKIATGFIIGGSVVALCGGALTLAILKKRKKNN